MLLRTLNDAEFPAVAVIALGESFAVLANIIRLGLAHFNLFGPDWEERIYAAKASGPVAAYRREMDAIAAKASL